jgi:hypothetical protein
MKPSADSLTEERHEKTEYFYSGTLRIGPNKRPFTTNISKLQYKREKKREMEE